MGQVHEVEGHIRSIIDGMGGLGTLIGERFGHICGDEPWAHCVDLDTSAVDDRIPGEDVAVQVEEELRVSIDEVFVGAGPFVESRLFLNLSEKLGLDLLELSEPPAIDSLQLGVHGRVRLLD